MTRECISDFEKLKSFINGYEIVKNLQEAEYTSSLKKMHKCYFASITWNAELLNHKTRFFEAESRSTEDIVFRLSEVVSDLGISLFNWLSGGYKACNVMLRVAIENFIRSAGAA